MTIRPMSHFLIVTLLIIIKVYNCAFDSLIYNQEPFVYYTGKAIVIL